MVASFFPLRSYSIDISDRQKQEFDGQKMTGSEILNIVVTVGVSQLCIDLLSNYFVYKGENYQRVCRRLESATSKLHRAEVELKKNPNKHQKKYDRTKAEYDHAAAEVAKKHMPPAVRHCFDLFFSFRFVVCFVCWFVSDG